MKGGLARSFIPPSQLATLVCLWSVLLIKDNIHVE